jgi:hypothetical protein
MNVYKHAQMQNRQTRITPKPILIQIYKETKESRGTHGIVRKNNGGNQTRPSDYLSRDQTALMKVVIKTTFIIPTEGLNPDAVED